MTGGKESRVRDILFGTAWRRMIVAKLVIVAILFAYKTQHYPYMGYQHLLVDYHWGFIKRALIGTIWSSVFPKVPIWAVFFTGGLVIVIAFVLFLLVFRRTFGFDEKHLPLFVFTACSPMVFANFVQTIGYFDVYGCIAALILLLMPARRLTYVLAAALMAMLLIVIHHIHTLMYVPTLTAIVGARYFLHQRRTGGEIAIGLAALMSVGVLFLAAQFAGSPPVPEAEFRAYMEARMAFPITSATPIDSAIWYQSLQNEFVRSWEMIGKNTLRLPVYALVLLAHLPLIAFFRRTVASLNVPMHRRLVWIAVIVVSVGYVLIASAVNDWSRWFANWGVCMVLLLFAIRTLPARTEAAPIAEDSSTRRFGWIVTAIPRIGTTVPF